MDQQSMNDTQASYDRVAPEYTRRIAAELADKPLDRALLQCFAEQVRAVGRACDIGTGPGHVARYLRECGVEICGIDLSPQMVAQARQLNPEIPFYQGDMRALELPNAALGGITAFYSLIHIPRTEIVRVLLELHRVLKPGGVLLLAFHVGQETVHLEEWWDMPVTLDFAFFEPDDMRAWLQAAGFTVEATITREPYRAVEHPSQRAYIFARKKLEGTEM